MITGLACANCGGALPAAAADAPVTCAYCGTTSVPHAKVIERVVERIVTVAVPGEATARLRCPRCAEGLREASLTTAKIAGCPRCGGLWLETATVEHFRRTHDEELERAARRLILLVTHGAPDRRPMISCPECAAPMRRVDVPDTVQSIDVCDAHGTWFDRDELSAFVTYNEEQRAGEVTDDDLEAAGVSGGFFTRLFRSVK